MHEEKGKKMKERKGGRLGHERQTKHLSKSCTDKYTNEYLCLARIKHNILLYFTSQNHE